MVRSQRRLVKDGPSSVVSCVHATRCSGCQYLGIPYEEQLVKKGERLLRGLGAYDATRSLVPTPVLGAPTVVGYRTRAKWVIGPKGEVGLYARPEPGLGREADRRRDSPGDGHVVVDIPSCRVIPQALLDTAAALRTLLQRGLSGEPGDGLSRALRAVDARHAVLGSTEAVLVTLVVTRPAPPRDAVVAFANALQTLAPVVVGVAVSTQQHEAPQVLGDTPVPLVGQSFVPDDVGTEVRATFGAFVQASREQARTLVSLVAAALPTPTAEPRVLDVYGGSGAFALALAERGADVELVESFAPAAELAESTARGRGLAVRAHAGDATALLEDAESERFDLVVVNPPRRGVARGAREALGRTRLDKLVYVSCEPRTLARDLAHFSRLGLEVVSLTPLDMMPQTEEVETVATLVRGAVAVPRVLFEDEDLLVIDKDPYEPTTPQGEHTSSLLARVRGLPGAEHAQPVHRLDRDTSGVCLFAKRASAVYGFAQALSAPLADKVYLALARGITHEKGNIARPLVEAGKTMHVTTRYRRRAVVSGHSLLEVRPLEGKKHQIRRHLASIGHPIVGDERHGDLATARYFSEKHGLDRTFLHCHRIAVVHPRTGLPLVLESALPGDLQAVLDALASAGASRPARSSTTAKTVPAARSGR